MSAAQMVLRIAVALACGGAIGAERELEDRAAGFRTYALVTLGSAVFTVLSIQAFPGSETARVAARIVVGIGFICAGVIILHGGTLLIGLTAAATLWASAAIGMAAGSGYVAISAYTTGMVLGVLIAFRWVEDFIIAHFKKKRIYFTVRAEFGQAGPEHLMDHLEKSVGAPRIISLVELDGQYEYRFRAQVPASHDLFALTRELRSLPGVTYVAWEEQKGSLERVDSVDLELVYAFH